MKRLNHCDFEENPFSSIDGHVVLCAINNSHKAGLTEIRGSTARSHTMMFEYQ